jgi:copper chaperone CopZ
MAQTILKVEGMVCNGCKRRVEDALQGIPGVTSVQVDLQSKKAVITGSASVGQFVSTVEELGFTVIK